MTDENKVTMIPPGGGEPIIALAQSVERLESVGWTRAEPGTAAPKKKAAKKRKPRTPAK